MAVRGASASWWRESVLQMNERDMNMKRYKAAIVDVDLTLVGDTPFIMEKAHDAAYLQEWHKNTLQAERLDVGVDFIKLLHASGFKLVIMTARDLTGRKELHQKLVELGIADLFHRIMMRHTHENGLPSGIVKRRMINDVDHIYDFKFAVDDSNHDVYKSLEIKVIDSNKWNGGK